MTFFHISELPQTEMLPGIDRRAVWLDNVMITFFTFQPHTYHKGGSRTAPTL